MEYGCGIRGIEYSRTVTHVKSHHTTPLLIFLITAHPGMFQALLNQMHIHKVHTCYVFTYHLFKNKRIEEMFKNAGCVMLPMILGKNALEIS